MQNIIDKIFVKASEYRSKPFWALNGKLEKDELIRQIQAMQEMGFGGVFLHSRTGLETEYMSDEWLSLMEACVDALSVRRMEAWLYDEDRWPSGTCGGMVAKKKSLRLKSIICEEISKDRYTKPSHLIALFSAKIKEGGVYRYRKIDSADAVEKGHTLLVFRWAYMEPMAFYNGFTYIDTLNKRAVEEFLSLTHERYKQRLGGRFGSEIKGIFQDEVNRGPLLNGFVVGDEARMLRIPYTYALFSTFKKLKKYELRDHLPLLYYRNADENFSAVMYDYTQVLMKMLLRNFAIPYYEWCGKEDIMSTGHVLHEDSLACQTTMLGSAMQYYAYMDCPGIDNLGTQNYRYEVPKLASSVSKQLGKRFTLSELYGCSGWQMNLNDYKHDGDWQAFMGVNFRCPHLSWYTMKGEAKRDCPASIMSQSAWYKEYRAVEDYFSALNACLSEGEDTVENLIVNPIESAWGLSRMGAYVGAFKVTDEQYHDLEKKYAELFEYLQKCGIDADFGDEQHIAEYGRVKNGLFYIGKKGYKRVLVSNLITIRKSTLDLLNRFAAEGGEVMFIARFPAYIDGRKIGEQVFAENTLLPYDLEQVVERIKDEKVTVSPHHAGIFVRKRRTEDGVLYAFLNSSKQEKKEVCIKILTSAELIGLDLRNRKAKGVRYVKEGNEVFLQYVFSPGEELILLEHGAFIEMQEPAAGERVFPASDMFAYSLSEENYLVLDRACLFDGEKWDEEEYILNKDIRLRQKHGIEFRFGEMVQPWYKMKYSPEAWNKVYGNYKIRYKFRVIKELPEAICLMMGDAERFCISVNGIRLSIENGMRSDIDICFKKYTIDKSRLRLGENEITLEFAFADSLNIEAIYLCGKFAVDRNNDGLYPLPEKLPVGDISNLGFPYYSGRLTYYLPVGQGKFKVVFNRIDAATILVNDEHIPFAPYESQYRYVDGVLPIVCVFNRKNLFGNNVNSPNGIVRDQQKQGLVSLPTIYRQIST